MKKMRWLLISLVLVLLAAGCINEKSGNNLNEEETITYSKGLKLTPEDVYAGFPKMEASMKRATLPSSVDLAYKFPKPGNQGAQGSCVGWASAYAYKSFQENQERKWGLTSNSTLFSPAYVYNQINGGRDQGSYFSDALNLIVKKGAATLADFPYNQYDYTKQPSSTVVNNAYKYRAASWKALNYGDVYAIKEHLATKGDGVIIGIPVYSDFENLNATTNRVYDVISGTNGGGHAITVIGYDDSMNAFKILNSWGTYWGDKGYGWVSYNVIQSQRVEAYVMTDYVETVTPPTPEPTPVVNLTVTIPTTIVAGQNVTFKGQSQNISTVEAKLDGYSLGKAYINMAAATSNYGDYAINTVIYSAGNSRKLEIIGYDSTGKAVKTLTNYINVTAPAVTTKLTVEVPRIAMNKTAIFRGDAVGIAKVGFIVDGYYLGAISASNGRYGASTVFYSSGTKKLELVGYDASGKEVSRVTKYIYVYRY